MAFGEKNRYQNFIDILMDTVHYCDEDRDDNCYRTIKLVYDRTNSIIIEGTQIEVPIYKWSFKKTFTPENATGDYITVRSNFDADVIMDFETVEDTDSLSSFHPPDFPFQDKTLCDWYEYIPGKDEKLYLKIKDYKNRDCECKFCKFIKAYIDMILFQMDDD